MFVYNMFNLAIVQESASFTMEQKSNCHSNSNHLYKLSQHIKQTLVKCFNYSTYNIRHVEKHILQLCSQAVLHFLLASIQGSKRKTQIKHS